MAMGRSSSLCPDLVTQATCKNAPQSHVLTRGCTGIQVTPLSSILSVESLTGSYLCCKAFYMVLLSVEGVLCDKQGKVGILDP